MVLVISSVPIALPVVSLVTMSVGCKELADKKAIVAELTCVEQLAGMNMLCSDKTGTLTLNRMVLQSSTGYAPGMDKATILRFAALAAKWKEPAKDALDTLVLDAVDKVRAPQPPQFFKSLTLFDLFRAGRAVGPLPPYFILDLSRKVLSVSGGDLFFALFMQCPFSNALPA